MDVKELRQFAGDETVQDVFNDLHLELAATNSKCRTLEAENAQLRAEAALKKDQLSLEQPAEQKTRYVASNNEESFNAPEADTVEGAISEAVYYYGMYPGDTVWVGEVVNYGNGEKFYPRASQIIERMSEDAWEAGGEFAEDYLSNVTDDAERELDGQIKEVIQAWIIKHKLQPKFFAVKNVKQQEVGADGSV